MVEFAMVVWVFLLLMFGALSAALHSLQREVAETAASIGVQVAASADPQHPDQPNLQGAYGPTVAVLQPVLAEREDVLQRSDGADLGVDREARLPQPLQQLGMTAHLGAALHGAGAEADRVHHGAVSLRPVQGPRHHDIARQRVVPPLGPMHRV